MDLFNEIILPPPVLDLTKVFTEIKILQKDNLSDLPIEAKEEKPDEEVKGLKFIAKKLKVLLEKNKKIQYNDASRILINNFASAEKDERNIKRRVYDAINVLVAAGVVTKENNKIQLVNIKQRPDLDSENQSKYIKKMKELQRLRRKAKILEKVVERNQNIKQQQVDEGKNSRLIYFDKKVNEVKLTKKNRKSINIMLKGVSKGTFIENFGEIIDFMV